MAYSKALESRSSSKPASEALVVSQISGCGDSNTGGYVVVKATLVAVESPPLPQAARSGNVRKARSLQSRITLPTNERYKRSYKGSRREASFGAQCGTIRQKMSHLYRHRGQALVVFREGARTR